MSQIVQLIPESSHSVSIQQALKAFLLECQVKNLAPGSINWYKERVEYFTEFLRTTLHEIVSEAHPLSLFTDENIKAFIQYYKHKGGKNSGEALSTYTIKGMVIGLKVFAKYLYEEGYLPENLAAKIKTPKVQKKIIQTFSAEHIQALLSVPNKNTFTGFRNYCILLTLVDTGIRLNELVHLKVNDIDLGSGTCLVLGKGNKERKVPFGLSLRKAFEKYLQWRGDKPRQDFLFVNQYGEKLKARRLQIIIQTYGKKAGITGVRVSPHTFRHTFAKMSLLNGMDVMTLQYILGHSSLEMVRHYINLTSQEVAFQKNRFSLLDRMEIKGITERKKLW